MARAKMSDSVNRLEDVAAADPLVREYAAEVALEEAEELLREVQPDGVAEVDLTPEERGALAVIAGLVLAALEED